MQITTQSVAQTLELGQSLVARIPQDCVVSLNGTLGAGKSVFVRGFATGLGIDPESVTSPTFTLWQTYLGQHPLHHLDAYRLDSVDEFYDLGGEELFEMPGVKLIEWGDKIASAYPSDFLRIEMEVVDEMTRLVSVFSHGELAIVKFD